MTGLFPHFQQHYCECSARLDGCAGLVKVGKKTQAATYEESRMQYSPGYQHHPPPRRPKRKPPLPDPSPAPPPRTLAARYPLLFLVSYAFILPLLAILLCIFLALHSGPTAAPAP